MPCHEERKEQLRLRIREMREQEKEDFKGELKICLDELEKLIELDKKFPHAHLKNRSGEMIAIYFESQEELEAFLKVWEIENARRDVEKTIEKKFSKRKEVER